MGCNCGKGGTIAQQRNSQAAFRAAGSMPGFDQDHPILIGETTEEGEVLRVRVMRSIQGIPVGRAVWVTGSSVADRIADGSLHDITNTAQKRRLFKVGEFSYTDEQDANRVAESLGVKPVEIA